MADYRKLAEGYARDVLDKDLLAWMRKLRTDGMSDEQIAREVYLESEGHIELTRNTVANYIGQKTKADTGAAA